MECPANPTGFRSRGTSISFVASSLATLYLTSPAAHSAELIRCPDWQRYITPTATQRSTPPIGPALHTTTPPKQSFETALATTRAREQRLPSAATQAGQGRGTLDAADIFSRDGRQNTVPARPPLKPHNTPTQQRIRT